MRKKIYLIAFAAAFLLLLFFAPYIGKAVLNGFLIKDTAVDLSGRKDEAEVISLKEGDYLVLGRYLSEPILWRVLSTEKGEPLLMTHYVICFKPFDAACTCGHIGDKDISAYGSSSFKGSTLEQWLNSAEEAVDYEGCRPVKANVHKGYNSYAEESGFLADCNFSQAQRKLIKNGEVFILKQSQLKKYMKTDKRVKTATASALKADEAPYLTTSSRKVWYWSGSSISTNRTSVSAVTTGGGFYKALAFDGAMGVAPSVYLIQSEIRTLGGDGSKANPYYIGR